MLKGHSIFLGFSKVNIIMGMQLFFGNPPAHIEWREKGLYEPKLDEPLCFTAVDSDATIAFDKVGSPDEAHIVTSTDGQIWTDYTFGTLITLANIGDKVYFRAADENDISFYKDSSNYYRFATTTEYKIAASGNIQTLMKVDGSRLDISGKDNCYQYMFSGFTSLTSAPQLPATTLAYNCYQYMFSGCTSLTSAPELPATTLASYCYSNMFSGCTSLTSAPELPATTLASNCYKYMFSGCTSLVNAPKLPATTLAYNCYYHMFTDCISLADAPDLPSTTLENHCYSNMFYNCTSLVSAPQLPAIALKGNCYDSIFRGCTSLTSAPQLPATTLVNRCYNLMFYGCTSLVDAPKLPATVLALGCYNKMFYSCTNVTELHYPASIENDDTFTSMSGSPVFGATNATVVYDL